MDDITASSWKGARKKMRWHLIIEPVITLIIISGVAVLVGYFAITTGGNYGL